MSSIRKATKEKLRTRQAYFGPSGSGKTYSALRVAKGFGGKIGLIDTEHGAASLYADDVAEFDVIELTHYSTEEYIAAIKEFAAAGYPVLIIDSLSHAWMGKGGILDQSDAMGGRFDAWRKLTPKQLALVDAILSYPGHVIVTMRTKTEYVVEKNEKGRSEPRKIGTAPVQKDGMEYEFDIVGSFTDGTMKIEKTRFSKLDGAVIRHPGEALSKTILSWLTDAKPQPEPAKAEPVPAALVKAKVASKPVETEMVLRENFEDEFSYLAGLIEARELVGFGDLVKVAHSRGSIDDTQRKVLRDLYSTAIKPTTASA